MSANNSIIVYLTGKPGFGKYTIAKELTKDHKFILCDNQLINNPALELIQYDGYSQVPDFAWEAIGKTRTAIFELLIKIPHGNYVLTNNLFDDEGDRRLYEEVRQMAETRGSLFIPIKLLVNQEEHLKRVTQVSRRERWKSIDPNDVYDETLLLNFTHPNMLKLDVSDLDPGSAANLIMEHTHRIRGIYE